MTAQTFFLFFIPLLALILLAINLIFAPNNPYKEKNSVFECGFHSFLGQNRSEFSISFFIFALLFLLFDLEILLVYPYIVSGYINGAYGLIILLIFFILLTLGFVFELGKNALSFYVREKSSNYNDWGLYPNKSLLNVKSRKVNLISKWTRFISFSKPVMSLVSKVENLKKNKILELIITSLSLASFSWFIRFIIYSGPVSNLYLYLLHLFF